MNPKANTIALLEFELSFYDVRVQHIRHYTTKTLLTRLHYLVLIIVNRNRPVTCLPMLWQILTAQIREKIYYSLKSRGIFSDEQKGCHKRTRGTLELLYIDQHIFNESKTRRKNLAMAWIDYKKAYDMVPKSWIQHCLKMYKIPD